MNTLRRERVGESVSAVSAVLMWATAAGASPSIVSDFEADLDGWVTSNTTAMHVTTGGNPGGYLFADNPESTVTSLIAPAKFRGDLRMYDGGTFSFDGNLLQQTGPDYEPYGTVTISGPGGSATRDLVQGQPTVGQWLTHSGLLDASLWNKTQMQWEAILENVTGLTIVFEAVFGGERNGIDNIRLDAPLLTGDLNADGFVGIEDLNIVLGNWNQSVNAGVWLSGDPSGDGFVGIEDLNAVLGNWNAGTPPTVTHMPSQVPEPGMASVLGMYCLVIAVYRSGNRLTGFG